MIFAYLSRRVGLKVGPFWSPCLAPAAASGVMAVAVMYVPAWWPLGLRLAAQVATGALMYAGLVRLIAPESAAWAVREARARLGVKWPARPADQAGSEI